MAHTPTEKGTFFSETPLHKGVTGGGSGGEWGPSPTCRGVWRGCSFSCCSSCYPGQTYFEGCRVPRSDNPYKS